MDNSRKELLESAGIDVEEAMTRFMNNENLLIKFVKKFSDDKSFSQLKEYIYGNNIEGAYEAAHTLKGVASNLSMKSLYAVAVEVNDYLKIGNKEKAVELFPVLEKEYEKIIEILKKLQ